MENKNDSMLSPSSAVSVEEIVLDSGSSESDSNECDNDNSVVDKREVAAGDENIATNNSVASASNEDSEVDILSEVVQLIDWVNSHRTLEEKSDKNSANGPSFKKEFTNGYLFIENLQSQLEDTQKMITEKDERIASILNENNKLKSTLFCEQIDCRMMRKKIAKFEQETNRNKKEEYSLGQLRSKMERLQNLFRTVTTKFEHKPHNSLDRQLMQKRESLLNFKRKIGERFKKVENSLTSWEKNQKDMGEELEDTRKAIEIFSEMINLMEQTRSSITISNSGTVPSPKPECSTTIPSANVCISPATEKNTTNLTKKKQNPPPALLPLTSFAASAEKNDKAFPGTTESISPNVNRKIEETRVNPSQPKDIPEPRQSVLMLHYPNPSSSMSVLRMNGNSMTSQQYPPSQLSNLAFQTPQNTLNLKRTGEKENQSVSYPATHGKSSELPTVNSSDGTANFGDGRSTTVPPGPSGKHNICKLCRMSFHTLVQLKLHCTVVHSKPLVPETDVKAASHLVPMRPLDIPAASHPVPMRQLDIPAAFHNTTKVDNVFTIQKPSLVEYGAPSSKKPCLAQPTSFLSSFPAMSLGTQRGVMSYPKEIHSSLLKRFKSAHTEFNATSAILQ